MALCAACTGLAWLCFHLYSAPISAEDIPLRSAWAPDAPSEAASFPKAAVEADPVILARLVFSSIRRPPNPRPAEPAATEPTVEQSGPAEVDISPPEGLLLQGVLIDEDRRKAFVTSPADQAGVWREAGENVGGWSISHIEPGGVILSHRNREVELPLYPSHTPSD
jgi:hypothetical protein